MNETKGIFSTYKSRPKQYLKILQHQPIFTSFFFLLYFFKSSQPLGCCGLKKYRASNNFVKTGFATASNQSLNLIQLFQLER